VDMSDTVVDSSVFGPNSAESNSARTGLSLVMGMSRKLDSSQEGGRFAIEGSYTVGTLEGIFRKSDKTPPEVARLVVEEGRIVRVYMGDNPVDIIHKNMQLGVTGFAEDGEGMVCNVDILDNVGILYTVGKWYELEEYWVADILFELDISQVEDRSQVLRLQALHKFVVVVALVAEIFAVVAIQIPLTAVYFQFFPQST